MSYMQRQHNEVHHTRVVPQESKTTGQTANEEAADTSNPNTTSVGPTEPAGTSYGPQDKSNEIDEGVEGQGEKDERGENDDGGTRTSPTATSYPIQPHLRVNHHPQHAAVPDGVSLVNPTSSQGSLPRAQVNTPRPHPTSESPNPPPSTPNPPFEQTASTSRRPTDQRSRNGHLPLNETRHTREHDEGSQRRGQSRSRGHREADNDDGKDNDIHQAHIVPQNPQSTRQTAYNEATDTSNLNATRARLTEPVGTLNGPLNESNENEGKGTKGEKGENDDSGDENVRHAYVVPSPTPPASRPPPSTPLEGEKEKGQQLSGRTDEAATHQIKPPRQKSRTTPPKRMPDDGRSSREGQGVAIGHRQAGKARDEPAIEVERKPIEREEGRSREPGRSTTATNTNENAPPPPPTPDHPEWLHHDDSAKTSKTAARIRADAQHNPGGETRAPEAKPPSHFFLAFPPMSTSFALIWAPTLVGYSVALAAYGATVGQVIYYARAFPSDRRPLKILVFSVFMFDSAHTILGTSSLYTTFIQCRGNTSPGCILYVPRVLPAGLFVIFLVTFMVQAYVPNPLEGVLTYFNSALDSFYAHTVWIISGQNRVITFGVIASTTAQFVLGLMVMGDVARTPTIEVLSSSKYQAYSAFASATCDAIITSSVFYYLRPGRTGFIRRGNIIKRLNLVFIQMGLLSFINALALVILYFVQETQLGQYLAAAPAVILSKTYANSMLAVLNSRKSIRDQRDHPPTEIDVPTLPTIC
ncbi:hypothetical protein PAXINDRAFT_100845 [Paxillus involutus ATCC 200175]|uniref:Unplaced genomic scaffold PAXINscaffold_33, whole genome shotgun sequence n=1 Tax=Paxillus involutus ATCC 200175 TaxID=664439 RepID=A0A0C9TS10_PAXIN|nr:hypothetical protein PAXINDRAFT_100845 [Paxillus involutus ATCC 200175]